MIYMTKSQFDVKMAKAQKRNAGIEYRRRLREERMKYWPKFVLPSTSKIMLGIASILCLETLVFCQYMIIATGDTNALYAMVGALFTFMGTTLGYYVKSTRENTAQGIVYETAMAQLQQPPIKTEDIPTDAVG